MAVTTIPRTREEVTVTPIAETTGVMTDEVAMTETLAETATDLVMLAETLAETLAGTATEHQGKRERHERKELHEKTETRSCKTCRALLPQCQAQKFIFVVSFVMRKKAWKSISWSWLRCSVFEVLPIEALSLLS